MSNLITVFPLKKTFLLLLSAMLLAGCVPVVPAVPGLVSPTPGQVGGPTFTPYPTRPAYNPGQLVDYTARSGDTLPALAARFNTSIDEIRLANPQIPADATTMPPGMPMQIPIYYRPFWGTQYQIIPDSLFVNGPQAIGFDVDTFISGSTGWLKDFSTYAQGDRRSGAEVLELVATNYSIDPRVLLTVMEYRSGALSQPFVSEGRFVLGVTDYNYPGLYMQLIWVANELNHGFYGWRTGLLTEFEHEDGRLERPDPWQTAASVGFQFFAALLYDGQEYDQAIGEQGFARVYRDLFGDPWTMDQENIPVSLQQPNLLLPFKRGETWAYTGGPHTGWGKQMPWAAIDFAPPDVSGCLPTDEPALAMADGVVARSETGVVMLDLDGDGDERTGWVLLYLHVATIGRAPQGVELKAGQQVGFPSCEGGTATGTHVHIARKYNGEWIAADSAIPFNLEGWVAHNGDAPYAGTLTRGSQTVIACDCSDAPSHIKAGE